MSSSDEYESRRAVESTLEESVESAVSVLDGAAVKPAEADVERAAGLPFDRVAIDYEGMGHFPTASQLADLASTHEVRVTVPVRADGFDPLGDDSTLVALPDGLEVVLVAGHPAYLSDEARTRSVAPRFKAAMEYVDDPWVGTENVERIALATGATQFELLSDTTERDLRALRAAGFDGTVAVYVPTVLTDDENEVLDAVGGYVARRPRVSDRLPEETATDSEATGAAREILLEAATNYALVGNREQIVERATAIRAAGADLLVGYPARGLEEFGV